jgi:hypothetical protein
MDSLQYSKTYLSQNGGLQRRYEITIRKDFGYGIKDLQRCFQYVERCTHNSPPVILKDQCIPRASG